jgi:hypothetical protein
MGRDVSLYATMRARSVFEGLAVLAVLALTCFTLFDEEPLLDLTDVSVLHVGLLFVGTVVVVADLCAKARYGCWLHKDLVSVLAAVAF